MSSIHAAGSPYPITPGYFTHRRLIQDYETRITDLKSELSSLQATHRKVLEEENATMKEAQTARRAKEAAEEK